MSTRAHIIIDNIHLYRHCDGYPEGVLPVIGKYFDRVTYADAEDLATYLVRNEDCQPAVGIHGDEEYLYVVTVANKKVETIVL